MDSPLSRKHARQLPLLLRIRRTTLLQGPTIVGWPRPSWSPGAFDKFAGKSLLPERASLGPSAPMFHH